jgi:cytosine/adenosine deaminase-related metal-dependent hydrolase
VERESEQVTQQALQAAISIGTTLIGAFLDRKAVTASTLGHATTAVRGAGRVLKERQDVGRAQETVEALQQQLADLDEAFKADAEKLGSSGDLLAEPLETLSVRPSKQNVTVKLVALAWVPSWQDGAGQSTPAWQ